MAELTPVDLENHTNGRLSESDPNTESVLNAALAYLRNYCKWHVTPVETVVNLGVDGPGQWGGLRVGIGGLYYSSSYSVVAGRLSPQRVGSDTLYLPTKKLLGISQITEDGVLLDLSTIQFGSNGQVIKTARQPWTTNYQGINITFTHGFTEDQAADWRRTALMIADRMSLVRGLVGPFNSMVGPYRLSAYYGTSRPGTLARDAGWLDDLTGLIDTKNYVIMEL
jgi:hypothetical protein